MIAELTGESTRVGGFPETFAQAAVIIEAARHDMGLDTWRPGRRGMVGQALRGIARLAANDELPLLFRRQQVYLWLRGLPTAPLRYYQPPDRFDARIEFEYEIESSQALLFPLRRLLLARPLLRPAR